MDPPSWPSSLLSSASILFRAVSSLVGHCCSPRRLPPSRSAPRRRTPPLARAAQGPSRLLGHCCSPRLLPPSRLAPRRRAPPLVPPGGSSWTPPPRRRRHKCSSRPRRRRLGRIVGRRQRLGGPPPPRAASPFLSRRWSALPLRLLVAPPRLRLSVSAFSSAGARGHLFGRSPLPPPRPLRSLAAPAPRWP